MGKITIHLDDKYEAKMREIAKAMNISPSLWLSNLVEEKISDVWPESVKQLAGAWGDFPDLKTIRKDTGRDIEREIL